MLFTTTVLVSEFIRLWMLSDVLSTALQFCIQFFFGVHLGFGVVSFFQRCIHLSSLILHCTYLAIYQDLKLPTE